MTFTYERKANYYETDMMGVVHHSNYLRYFEEARIAFMDSLGIPYKELEENGISHLFLVFNVNTSVWFSLAKQCLLRLALSNTMAFV